MSLPDVVSGVISNCVFVIIVLILFFTVWAIARLRFARPAANLFGIQGNTPITIFISAFEHSGVLTRRVVNAAEYEAAVNLTNFFQGIAGPGLLRSLAMFLGGLIGIALPTPVPTIVASPLEDLSAPPVSGPVIAIGGPIANQVTKYYLSGSPRYSFDAASSQYQLRMGTTYVPIQPSNDVAIVEKRVVGGQPAVLLHGFGENQTARAVQFLMHNWRRLASENQATEFAERV